MQNINFLKERNRIQELELIRDRRIAVGTSIVLVIFFAVIAGLFSYQLYLNNKVTQLQAATTQEQNQLRSLSGTELTYTTMTSQLKTIQSIISKRGNKWDAITHFYNLLPPGSVINSIDLTSGNKNELDFSVQSASVFAYTALSSVLQSSAGKNGGYTFQLGILSRGRDGIYRTDVSVFFNNPGSS
ncbi:hypothetical protein C5B42_04895 [Candidatus Cerribacteria bacterium 'Amazon FNV 2010 28 9']|uniref:PilN domain-containing protein n=1 Tax=Candidatus Cerribacteria bacterium 'Amazon FNV 2010 28 9' TaxID=2081795 RepID=A0A317JMY3_9BACT|nr:MAG: hypothetical protein C5B42_04895 [Candidatus Cerribacteria bacterium 'Amazon FNV 2010 28 9']